MSNKEQSQSQPQSMIAGYYPLYQAPQNDDDIDLFDFIAQLWKKRRWIVGCMLVTTLLAAVYAFTAEEQWTATAVVDAPGFSSMNNYYQGTRLLEGNVDKSISSEEVADKLFKQFISQASSYNELSKFISESDYFKKLVEGKSEQKRAKLLNEIISDVKVTKEKDSSIYSFSFPATTSAEAKKLLEKYIEMVNANVSQVQYAQLTSQIENKKQTLQNQMLAIKKVAEEQRLEEIKNIKMALTVAERTNIQKPEITGLTKLDSNRLFLLGKDALSAMSESIEKQPLVLGDDYYNLQRQLINLINFKVNSTDAKGFSYLKSPILPIENDKPKRIIILSIGLFLGLVGGIGIVLLYNEIKRRKIDK
ncbi:LPS O-antigen chain length determinant protein WzzB [Budviciaceae bacterium BWR-B9]|uniref:LPS O-antigen chain length determinant protein WzzB n=1 Tax=Limnobaculum allomyrinae TaxID=2791986 RepID=A0ABS1ITH4_9GAMM|nr:MULTISPECIES: Wzz/FepE/Etk N-terminal domain-containing protein [Limnobaculum]MBK5145041.1 LPS O-antigen chain length determinant protein WzzB [Limnobaculum allomyrinae]MBV7692872.1 hypothetical protein [Limnobaculum sp. M2-1]